MYRSRQADAGERRFCGIPAYEIDSSNVVSKPLHNRTADRLCNGLDTTFDESIKYRFHSYTGSLEEEMGFRVVPIAREHDVDGTVVLTC